MFDSLAEEIATISTCFRVVSEAEKDRQEENKVKLRSQLSFPEFKSTNEAAFKDWVGLVVRQISKQGQSVSLFQRLMDAVLASIQKVVCDINDIIIMADVFDEALSKVLQ